MVKFDGKRGDFFLTYCVNCSPAKKIAIRFNGKPYVCENCGFDNGGLR